MTESECTIVVSGDICINTLYWRTDLRNSSGLSWQSHQNIHSIIIPGEALLLSRLIALSTEIPVCSPQMPAAERISAGEFLRSVGEVDQFATATHPLPVYRWKNFLGFSGPASGPIQLLPIENDTPDADIVVIDDENNGYNIRPSFWPSALSAEGKTPLVIYKLSTPDPCTPLWQKIEADHLSRTIVVINSEDLRSKGVNISKGLSWERTAQDFVWQIHNSPHLSFLACCRHLVVLFGLEGAIYYRNESGTAESHLYFLPSGFEGGTFSPQQGLMTGYTSCFVAAITRCITKGASGPDDLSAAIGDGIRLGIVAAQKYFMAGFGSTIQMDNFPQAEIFNETDCSFICRDHVQDVPIRPADGSGHFWYILKEKSSTNLAEIAYDIVKKGMKHSLPYIPIAQFDKLQTVDRAEIESYRSIKNLMGEYVSTPNTTRPLSIAVFGTPGSGKSFGVTQIASSIAPKLIQRLNFNLSQFRTPQELITAFHRVRDLSLDGKIPLVFFDEFDSFFEGPLGWLKYFLAPMQDGVFREGDSQHSIGKTIFVFAGGTSHTLKAFCGEDVAEEKERKQFLAEFKRAKGPDFLSRLRGYVNILGPNQTDPRSDQLFIIRRAMLLRSLLEKKVPHLIHNDEAQIDTGVLRALLKTPRYKHESRSMEAILDMSLLVHAKKWEQSHLPSREQLRLHVDEDEFLRHLMHDTFYSEKIEALSMALHDLYCSLHKNNPYIPAELIKPWDELAEHLKAFAREQARHIPDALLVISYDVVSVKDTPTAVEFTEAELDLLAAYEHSYWMRYKKSAGWKKGETIDWVKKTDPDLVKWEALSADKKFHVYNTVKSWPAILANANFKLEHLRFSAETHE